jgi:DeoR family transcriptional regulator, fructose operon transcriptional repressor
MLLEERHQAILNMLEERGSVAVTDLVARFNVSEMTIRRDLDNLERGGYLRRVHGGAITDHGRSYEPSFLTRAAVNQELKERIGKAAAELVTPGDSLILDTGTTTLEIARNLTNKNELTIITPCFQIASVLAGNSNIRLILAGGILRPKELSMYGPVTERTFADYFVDKLFLGAAGVDFTAGLTEFNLEDTLVKHAMLRCAKHVILTVDSSKFNRVAFTAIAPLKVVHTVVTNSEIEPAIVTRLKKENIDVVLA